MPRPYRHPQGITPSMGAHTPYPPISPCSLPLAPSSTNSLRILIFMMMEVYTLGWGARGCEGGYQGV